MYRPVHGHTNRKVLLSMDMCIDMCTDVDWRRVPPVGSLATVVPKICINRSTQFGRHVARKPPHDISDVTNCQIPKMRSGGWNRRCCNAYRHAVQECHKLSDLGLPSKKKCSWGGGIRCRCCVCEGSDPIYSTNCFVHDWKDQSVESKCQNPEQDFSEWWAWMLMSCPTNYMPSCL